MADQVFTSGDLRVIADVVRAIANGTIETPELQERLNRNKVTAERMPVWIQICQISHANSTRLEIHLHEEHPQVVGHPIVFATVEDVEAEGVWSFPYISIFGKNPEWSLEVRSRLMKSSKIRKEYKAAILLEPIVENHLI